MISTLDSVALVLAGVAAGLIGSAGGITSLVSYPALLAVGLPALPANVANNVALVACWPGSALASGPELRGRASWVWRWAAVAAAGGAAGAGLLLSTPPGVFARVVPFLVATGALALLFEPRLTAWRERRASHPGKVALPTGVATLSLYNGYFGAGAGVMTLTLMLMLVDRHLPTANALKNMLVGAGTLRRGDDPRALRLGHVGGVAAAGARDARGQPDRPARRAPAPGRPAALHDRGARAGARGRPLAAPELLIDPDRAAV